MEIYESNHWKVIFIFQKCIGLWVFEHNWKTYLSWICVYFLNIQFMIVLGARLYIELGVDSNIVTENIIGEMYLMCIFLKLTISILKKKQLKYLYEQIANDWKTIEDAEELAILHKYSELGRKIICYYTGGFVCSLTIFVGLPVAITFLESIFSSGNVTLERTLPYYVEYGIDQHKYYYPLVSQTILGGFVFVTTMVTFDTAFMLFVQHVIAVFALVNIRIGKILDMSDAIENQVVDYFKGDLSVHLCIVRAIHLHQTVIRHVDLIENCYSITWLFVLMLNMIVFGFSLPLLVIRERFEDRVRYFSLVVAGLAHFYFLFLPGQKIINSSSTVLNKCYSCKWYNLPEKSKSLIKIMMIRSLRYSEITGGKMFVLCMTTFCDMMKTGFSIYTVLR